MMNRLGGRTAMSHRSTIRALTFAALAWLSVAPAFGQQYLELPPHSVVGNLKTQSNPSFAVQLNELAAGLMLDGGLVQGPASATAGHAAVFGATGNVIVDGGGIAGTGTVTSVTCGAGLSGGTIAASGTCALNIPISPQGRLTLASATPVMTSTVSGATSVIYTPYTGSIVSLFDGTNMVPTAFSEISQATTDATKSPAAVSANQIYDIFVWSDSGTVRATRGPAWTNNTTRSAGTALVRVQGLWLNNASITNGPAAQRGTYVGTVASNSGSTVDFIFGGAASGGTAAVLNVFNAFNRVSVGTTVTDTSAPYTYSSSTVRQAHNNAGMQVTFVTGAAEDFLTANGNAEIAAVANGVGSYGIGIELDLNLYVAARDHI